MPELSTVKQFTYYTNELDNCKAKWTFFILKKEDDLFVEELVIEENETLKGCLGHPKTIMILLKGQKINSINIDALMETECIKDMSCGQLLGNYLNDIKSQYERTI